MVIAPEVTKASLLPLFVFSVSQWLNCLEVAVSSTLAFFRGSHVLALTKSDSLPFSCHFVNFVAKLLLCSSSCFFTPFMVHCCGSNNGLWFPFVNFVASCLEVAVSSTLAFFRGSHVLALTKSDSLPFSCFQCLSGSTVWKWP